jgi:hypothetical protein
MGVGSTLSQGPTINRTQATLGRDWVCLGDYLWEQYFSALKNFKRRKGHCCVPIIYKVGDLKLGWWVATQRRNRKEMLAERRARLNKIGFVWRAPRPYRPTGAPRHVGDPSDSGHPNCPAL